MSGIMTDSRYASTQAVYDIDTGTTRFWQRERLELPPAASDRWVPPKLDERLDAMAYRMWGATFGERATRLFWVICDLNRIARNPFVPLDPTTKLRIISTDRIVLEVL